MAPQQPPLHDIAPSASPPQPYRSRPVGAGSSDDDEDDDASVISTSCSSTSEDDCFHDAEDTSSDAAASLASLGDGNEGFILVESIDDEFGFESEEGTTCGQRLSPDLEALASTQLHEDPRTKAALVREFRAWAKDNPCIKRCRLDDNFLLRFLRMKKFNLENAKDTLMRYFKFRHAHPNWAADLDIENPTLMELTSKGFVFVLPERDDQGRRVLFNIAQKLDPTRHTSSDMAKMFLMCMETLQEDEENQIRGVVYISDCKDLALPNIMIWTPSDIQTILTRGEKAYPLRHKMIHFMSLPLYAWFAYELLRGCLSQKLKSRIMGHSDSSKLADHVPKRILPKEYGGTVPLADMTKQWIDELRTHRKKVLALDDMEYLPSLDTNAHHAHSHHGWGFKRYLNKAWSSAWKKAEKMTPAPAIMNGNSS